MVSTLGACPRGRIGPHDQGDGLACLGAASGCDDVFVGAACSLPHVICLSADVGVTPCFLEQPAMSPPCNPHDTNFCGVGDVGVLACVLEWLAMSPPSDPHEANLWSGRRGRDSVLDRHAKLLPVWSA
jgi:hypothetical protein